MTVPESDSPVAPASVASTSDLGAATAALVITSVFPTLKMLDGLRRQREGAAGA